MPIETYLQFHLIPHLGTRGLDDAQIQMVADDVRRRLASLLGRWSEQRFRETVLLLGKAEATFYEPEDVDLLVRSLVVVAVRNSRLEDLSSTPEAARHLGLSHAVLPDADLPMLTREAARYFAEVDLAAASARVGIPPPADDVFGKLPTRFPVAWRALAELAALPCGDATYAPLPARPPALRLGRPVEARLSTMAGAHIVSGMERGIEPELQRLLRLVKTGLFPGLFADSFKMITRDPEKLFAVIEFVLGHGRAVVTHNYYLRNGYVARRTPLLRPAHTLQEAQAKFHDSQGLLASHAEIIARFAPVSR